MEQMDDGGRMVSSLRRLLKFWEISFMSVIISNLKKKKKKKKKPQCCSAID